MRRENSDGTVAGNEMPRDETAARSCKKSYMPGCMPGSVDRFKLTAINLDRHPAEQLLVHLIPGAPLELLQDRTLLRIEQNRYAELTFQARRRDRVVGMAMSKDDCFDRWVPTLGQRLEIDLRTRFVAWIDEDDLVRADDKSVGWLIT